MEPPAIGTPWCRDAKPREPTSPAACEALPSRPLPGQSRFFCRACSQGPSPGRAIPGQRRSAKPYSHPRETAALPRACDRSCTHMPPLPRSNALSRCQPPHAPTRCVISGGQPMRPTDRPGWSPHRVFDDALNVPTTPRPGVLGASKASPCPPLPPSLPGWSEVALEIPSTARRQQGGGQGLRSVRAKRAPCPCPCRSPQDRKKLLPLCPHSGELADCDRAALRRRFNSRTCRCCSTSSSSRTCTCWVRCVSSASRFSNSCPLRFSCSRSRAKT